MLLKCEKFRTVPVPGNHALSQNIRPSSLLDEFRVLRYLYDIANSFGVPHLIAKPEHFFHNLLGMGPCYSMKLLGSPSDWNETEFVSRQKKWLENHDVSTVDSIPFWEFILKMENKGFLDSYAHLYDEFLSNRPDIQISTQVETLKNDLFHLYRILKKFHEMGYVHGDLPGNIILWKDDKNELHYSVIDPLGFRPVIHYACRIRTRRCYSIRATKSLTTCQKKLLGEIYSDSAFIALLQRDEDAIHELVKAFQSKKKC